jgi:hypothetical protein
MTLLAALILAACSSPPQDPTATSEAPVRPTASQPAQAAALPGPAGPPGPMGPPGTPGPAGGPGGVHVAAEGSGGSLQDPSGFPDFHGLPSPPGPSIEEAGAWSAPTLLSETPGGGYRPQVTVDREGSIHAVYYERTEAGDLLRHRSSDDGVSWSPPVHFGFSEHRNWGPDLITRDDGSLVVVFDHMLPDFTSRGYLTTWDGGAWSAPEPLTPAGAVEVGSGHIARGTGDELAYVYIGRSVEQGARFQAWSRWHRGGAWQPATALSDGSQDAWHTNVERRPDGSVMMGFDIGTGGSETTLYTTQGRDGAFAPLEDMTATGRPGERPHFAFELDGTDHVTWFHKEQGLPVHVYVRSGGPGRWGSVEEPSAGYGGFHFDPEIAVNDAGTLCLVWGWDAGAQAEMVYSLRRDGRWDPPRRIATIGEGKPGLASLVAGPDGRFHVVWNQGVRGSNLVHYASLDPR